MIVKNFMKERVFSVQETDSIRKAAQMFVEHHVGTLPVVNAAGKLVGVLQLRDVLTLVLPDFTRLMEDFDFVRDFGAMEAVLPSEEMLAKKVADVMEEPFCVDDTCGLLLASALLHQHRLNELPVVDAEKRLVGIVSRVDIGTGILGNWNIASGE